MPTGIPNKKKEVLKNIDEEMTQPQAGEIVVSKQPSVKAEGSNEFGDEYTMEVISDNEAGADMFRIPNPDPNFSYRFLRDDPDNMSVKTSNLLLQKGGWQVCPKAHLKRIGISENLLQPDGTYKVGKMFLAFMPMKFFLMKSAEDRRKAKEATSGVQRLVDGDSRINMKGVHGISKGKIKTGPLNYGTHNEIEN